MRPHREKNMILHKSELLIFILGEKKRKIIHEKGNYTPRKGANAF